MVQFIKSDGGRVAAGYSHEVRDCVVRAISNAYCLPYAQVHEEVAKAGRKDRGGISTVKAMQNRPVIWTIEKPHRTVGGFIKDHPHGHFVIRISGHALASVDGVLYDQWLANNLKCHVKQAWKVL